MPLSDGYETEKNVKKETLELAKAITEFFDDMGVQDRRAFILFICDFPTGCVQFMSDMDREASYQVLKNWVKERAGVINAQASEGAQPITEQNFNHPDNGTKDKQ